VRICFINPPRPWLVNPHAQAPIGILYLAAALERAGHDVRIVNCAGHQQARQLNVADVYCITGTWLDVPQVNEIAEFLKGTFGRCRILVGGPIALSPDELSDDIDVIVRGEAEADILSIVDMESIPCSGLYTCEPPDDLDALPFPARHLWAGPFGGNVFIGGENYFGGGSTTILSSRGCPYDCAFCASSALAPRKVRFRSAESVVEEMEQCVVDFGVRQFRFSDENFNACLHRVEALCDAIMSSKILGHGDGVAWRASIAVRPINVGTFDYMADAGCKEVSIGVESADSAVLELICPAKLKSPNGAVKALAMATSAGLKTRALMMVGTPGENADTARLNIDFMHDICNTLPGPWSTERALCDALAVTVFTPMPGSDIYNHPERYGCRIRGAQPPSAGEADTVGGDCAPRRSVCLYGPDGAHALEPTIELDDFPLDALRQSMRTQVAAAEATGKIGRG